MVEFNPDGSIKLPGHMAAKREENKNKMQSQRCMSIRREVVNHTAPKKCVLKIRLSNVMYDSRFIDTIYGYFKERATVPNKLTKINEKEFEVEIGTDFRRCTDCASLRNEFREFLNGNIIDDKGNCTFEGRKTNFQYEDYFE